jgi:hypothetical protein
MAEKLTRSERPHRMIGNIKPTQDIISEDEFICIGKRVGYGMDGTETSSIKK